MGSAARILFSLTSNLGNRQANAVDQKQSEDPLTDHLRGLCEGMVCMQGPRTEKSSGLVACAST